MDHLKKICVVGASGLVGSSIVRCGLEKGYILNGTLRDAMYTNKTKYLYNLVNGSKLKLYSADMKNEIDFYRIFNILNTEKKHIFPKIYDIQPNKFELEKIDGKNIYDINVDQNIIKKIINKLDYLHNMSTKDVSDKFFEKNLIYEFRDKIHKRLTIIEPILNHFNFIKKIKNNGTIIDIDLSIKSISEIVDTLYDSIEYYFENAG